MTRLLSAQEAPLRISSLFAAVRLEPDGDEDALDRALSSLGRLDLEPPLALLDHPLPAAAHDLARRRDVEPPPLPGVSSPEDAAHARRRGALVAHGRRRVGGERRRGVETLVALYGMRRVDGAVELDVGVGLDGDAHEVLAQGRVARGRGLAAGAAAGHEQAQRLRRGRQVQLGGDDLEELGDARADLPEELGAHCARVDPRVLAADLEDQLVRRVVDERPRVVDPARRDGGRVDAVVRHGRRDRVRRERDARLEQVLDAQQDLAALPGLVEADVVRDEALLEALEVEVAAVTQQARAVLLVAHVHGVPLEQVDEVGEDVGGPVRHGRRLDGRRPDQALALEPREDFLGRREEDGVAQREEVGAVARALEEVARDLEFAVAYRHEDALLVELRHQLGQRVELRIGKEAHKVRAVSRGDMIALKVQGDVLEGLRVPINVESTDSAADVLPVLLGTFDLAQEILREI